MSQQEYGRSSISIEMNRYLRATGILDGDFVQIGLLRNEPHSGTWIHHRGTNVPNQGKLMIEGYSGCVSGCSELVALDRVNVLKITLTGPMEEEHIAHLPISELEKAETIHHLLRDRLRDSGYSGALVTLLGLINES